jgi:hypothetical protein
MEYDILNAIAFFDSDYNHIRVSSGVVYGCSKFTVPRIFPFSTWMAILSRLHEHPVHNTLESIRSIEKPGIGH